MASSPSRSLSLLLLLALAGCGGATHHRSHAQRTTTASASTTTATMPGAHRAPRERVPILMYHVIDGAPAGTPLPGLWVPREEFKSEVDGLAARGYHAVTLAQVWKAWHQGGLLPSKPIVFSFDDGYASQYTNAMPILRGHRWPGVLNLEVATLHTTLRSSQVRGLVRAGWEVDAHTMTHPDLRTVYGARLRYEVATSRRWIHDHFGVPVDFFCYPAGRYDAHVIAAVKDAGYLAATTTNEGVAAPSNATYELPRVRVNPGEGLKGVESSLKAAAGGTQPAAPAGE
jgi:peptidoglycan/xylan/chitin deacetylase (PgdA/CDA1 family)